MAKGICPYFSRCSFYRKYSRELAGRDRITVFHDYISVYCYGELRSHCYRLINIDVLGEGAPADITPTGIRYSQPEKSCIHSSGINQ